MYCVKCHDATTMSGGLNLDITEIGDYTELFMNSSLGNSPDTTCNEPYVNSGNPGGSLLYQKVSGIGIPAGCGVQMPKGGPYLSTADQTTIMNWILYGEAP
jgi:hypothetical protein